MKKLVSMFLATLLLFALVACGGTNAAVSEPSLEPQISGYITADYELLNSPASENGMDGTLIYFRGTAGSPQDLGGGAAYYIVVTTDDGDWGVILGDMETADLEKIQAAALAGKQLDVYANYMGFTSTLDLPVCYLADTTDTLIVVDTGVEYGIEAFRYDVPEVFDLGVSTEEAIEHISTQRISVEFPKSGEFEEGGYKVSWLLNDTLTIFVYSDTASGQAVAVRMQLDKSKRNYTNSSSFPYYALSTYEFVDLGATSKEVSDELRNFNTLGTYRYEGGGMCIEYNNDSDSTEFLIYPAAGVPDPSVLVSEFTIVPPSILYLDSELIGALGSLNNSYKYAEMVEQLEAFIEENELPEDDEIYILLDLAMESRDLIASCKVVFDDFDNKYYIYYAGVEAISSSINTVPYLKDGESTMRLGFQKSGWLFFDSLEIKTGNVTSIKKSPSYSSLVHDVISGGTIQEYVEYSLSAKDATAIYEYEAPVIRFTNKDDDASIDHTLTPAEIEAFRVISTLDTNFDEIRAFLRAW